MLQPDAFADMVVLTIKTALGPVLERLAAAEARLSMLPATDKTVAELRDRVVAVETKAAMPLTTDATVGELRDRLMKMSESREVFEHSVIPECRAIADIVAKDIADLRVRIGSVETREAPLAPSMDLGPMGERVAAAEARLSVLGDLRDRVVAVETKAAVPVPDAAIGEIRDRVLTIETKAAAPTAVDHALTEMKSRLTVLESRDVVTPPVVGEDIRDRLLTLETRAAGPSVTDMAVVDIRERLGSLERRVSDDKVTQEIAAIRERLAVAEVKAPVAGQAGKDGANGRDGTDGMGWDDLSVAHDGERVFTIKMMRGERVKDAGTVIVPVDIYRGVYVDGKSYERGDGVTWAGSEWHCNEPTTTKPGDGSKAWTLKVKRGRDGKDGRDGHDSLPVVSVGRSA